LEAETHHAQRVKARGRTALKKGGLNRNFRSLSIEPAGLGEQKRKAADRPLKPSNSKSPMVWALKTLAMPWVLLVLFRRKGQKGRRRGGQSTETVGMGEVDKSPVRRGHQNRNHPS